MHTRHISDMSHYLSLFIKNAKKCPPAVLRLLYNINLTDTNGATK